MPLGTKEVCGIKLEKQDGLIVLILSIVFSGIGTIYAGFKAGGDLKQKALILGIVQWLLGCFLIGWLWAVYTGWKIYSNSK